MFTKSYCPHSKAAKALFDSINVPYAFLELDHEAGVLSWVMISLICEMGL